MIALWTGHRASAFRMAYRQTVEGFAAKVGVAARTVAKWEANPDIIPTPALQEALDVTLERAPGQVRARLSLLLADAPAAPQGVGGDPAGGVGKAAGAMQAFRMADLRVGGGHLYLAVMSYLRDEVAPLLVCSPGDSTIFTAAAAITEMAGWMAHDAGRDEVALGHFGRSLDLVRAGDDRPLQAHVLASMSHLQDHLRRPGDAIRLAQAGRDALAGGPREPAIEARLLAMEARGRAALRDGDSCVRLLNRAEDTLGAPQDQEPSSWVSAFDEAALANETARCMHYLGDLAEAQRQAARIIELRPASRPRSRAFGLLMLAGALAGQGKHEEACAAAGEVLDAAPALGSHIVVQQLHDLTCQLEPKRSAPPVGDFLDRLEADIEQRMWLFRQLGNDGRRPATAEIPA